MSSFMWIAIGLLIGAVLLEAPGAIIGASIGFLIGKFQDLSRLISSQQSMIDTLKNDHAAVLKKLPIVNPLSVESADTAPSQAATETKILEPEPESEPQTESELEKEPKLEINQESELDVPDTNPEPIPPQALVRKPDLWVTQDPSPASKTNLITRTGIVVLFFGVAFLLKYTAQNVSVSIEMRLLLVATGAAILLFFGWKLRHTRTSYAVLLQGAGVGIWYIVTYAALNSYEIIPATGGFILMLLVSVFAVALAVLQDSKALAIFAIAGGFLAPILASTGSGSHVMLFSYYAILNVGIVAITWFKVWRSLTLLGFIFTFVIGVAWGVTKYSPEHFSSTEPFLILFIVFYIAVVMMFALRKKWDHSPVFDGPLVFGTPVIGFITKQTFLAAAQPNRKPVGMVPLFCWR